MKVDMWIPIYVGDYLSDTMDLTTEEHGIYFLLLLQYWKKGILTSDISKLQIITKTSQKNKQQLTNILDNYFKLEKDKYVNKRIEIEIQKAKTKREVAIENGKKGGRPPKNNNPNYNPE